jgi:predicted GTPase
MDSIYNSIFDSNKILQKEVPTADEVKEHIEAIKANWELLDTARQNRR